MKKITLTFIILTVACFTVLASWNHGYKVGIQTSAVDVPVFEDSVSTDDEEVCSPSMPCESNQD